MMVETLLLLVQIGLLGGLVVYSSLGSRNELERVLNPAGWFLFFYTLWMLIPQLMVLGPDHPLVGLESWAPSERAAAVMPTQLYLIAFLVSLSMGYVAATLLSPARAPGPARLPLEQTQWVYALGAFAIGAAAFFVLGQTYAGLPAGTMRSALVKTPTGRVMMMLSFFGSFAAAYLAAHLWLLRKRLLALLLFGGYVFLVFQINARGRMMWPAMTLLLFVAMRGQKFPLMKLVPLGVLALAVLALIDPLFLSLRAGDMTRFYESLSPSVIVELLFFDRNFDGFSNFLFITQQDLIDASPLRLLTGSRDVFMNTYFPDVYDRGVAFPTTIPGEFWLAGKTFYLAAFGAVYGLFLGLLNTFIRNLRRESHLWIYLLAMPWIAAVGGELAESVDKMIAACLPAIIWAGTAWLLGRRRTPVLTPAEHS